MSAPEFCEACGHPARDGDPLVKVDEHWWIHESHTTDPASGFYQAEVQR